MKVLKKKLKVFIYFINIICMVLISKENVMSMTAHNAIRPIRDLAAYQKDVNQSEKIIYLTFDDGPSNLVTNRVLDILKGNDVKATFFLIGNQIDGLENVVRRINEEGHSIGLHTYTHKFKRIYPNKDAFIKEMLKCNDKIKEVTGVSSNIIRFPGGSQRRLTETYVNKLHSYNFKIYDWNMETVDGLNPKASPDKFYRQATKGSEELGNIILLLHCDYMHKNTCKALPRIIKYYKDKGYEFRPITEDTPELYFPITKKL
jgi:peptidoglycan-N-acetylglucosamine deacetylase